MTDPRDQESPGVANAFLQLFLEDRAAGRDRPLKEYQQRFPGFETLIAREFERLSSAVGPRSASDTSHDAMSYASPGVAVPEIPHESIGPYKLLSVLGEGGMGVVYLASQKEPIERRVALKLVKLGMDTREVLARFESERQALALMNHTNIAKVLDAGTAPDGRPFFVMELVQGVPVTKFCDQQQLRTRDRLELFTQICEGVQHAHQKGIVHRDLKPSNVLVTFDGDRRVVKIIDFGVARSLNQRLTERTVFTQYGQIVGTPEYMSPEQATMDATDVDTRTDIYSLGVLLYELIAGALPFDSKTLRSAGYEEIQRKIREVEPPKPSTKLSSMGEDSSVVAQRHGTAIRSLVREVSGDLDWITMKALDKDRTRRYSSASELAADVWRHLREEPVLAGPPSVSYRCRKFVRRHRRNLVTAAFALVAIAATTSIVWRNSKIEAERVQREETESLIAQGTEVLAAYRVLVRDTIPEHADATEVLVHERRSNKLTWYPPWHPEEQRRLGRHRAREKLEADADAKFSSATGLLNAAITRAPDDTLRADANAALAELIQLRFEQATTRSFDGVGTAKQARAFFVEEGEVTSPDAIPIRTTPIGAEVLLFRFVESENRLVPIPFHPSADASKTESELLERMILRVEHVTSEELLEDQFEGDAKLQVGDRVTKVNRRSVNSRTQVAEALRTVRVDQSVPIEIERDGTTLALSWTPFPTREDEDDSNPLRWAETWNEGEVVNFRVQFGFIFEGSPIELSDGNRLGETPLPPQHLSVGSYLLVFRLDGHVTARVPLSLPGPSSEIEVNLVTELPENFVHVPAGPAELGGFDSGFRQQIPHEVREVPAFAMDRFEVTLGEYLEFLNDPEVRARIDEKGRAGPAANWDHPQWRHAKPEEDERILLVPSSRSQLRLVRSDDGSWGVGENDFPLDWPVFGVSMRAAVEYAHWRTQQSQADAAANGTRSWTFRIPTDDEWEKAARGADGRRYVWGNRLVWSYARWALSATKTNNRPDAIGVCPMDESVYGIRDLAGSMDEPSSGRTIPTHAAYRGANWWTSDLYRAEAATRFGARPDHADFDQGIRLVVGL